MEDCEYHRLLNAHLAAIRESERAFAVEVEKLRAACQHAQLTRWLPDGEGNAARLCRRCMKTMEQARATR